MLKGERAGVTRSPRSYCWLAAEIMVRDGGAMAVGITGGVATSATTGEQARRPYMTMEMRDVPDPRRMVNQLAMDLWVVDLPSSVCKVCPVLVTAFPPPGTYGRGMWEEGKGVLGERGEFCGMTLSSSLSPMAGKPSTGDGGMGIVVPARMCGRDGSGTGVVTTSCGRLIGGGCEELDAARLSRFLLDTYSFGSVPACCGLPCRQTGQKVQRQFVH